MESGYVVETPFSLCQFGVARRDITPPVGIYHRMWGAAAHERSEGVHRPLTSTALVFSSAEDPRDRQVLVALDHCLLLHAEMEQLTQRICSAVQIESEQLLITFSHTHAAGLMDPNRSGSPGVEMIAPYLQEVAAATATAIREAIDALQSATITYLTGRCNLAAHRDLWDSEHESFVCGFNPAGNADDTLLVARVTDDRDKPVATIVNYACHPTTLAWDNRLISPDFPGAMRELVEQETGALCVFLQGASGDLGPRHGFVGDTGVADRNGRQLGYAVLATLEAAPPPRTRFAYAGPVVSGATIGTWSHEPLDDESQSKKRFGRQRRWTVDLRYCEGLASAADTRTALEHWTDQEQTMRVAGDEAGARDARAFAERARRLLARLSVLPAGDVFPYPISLWRFGDAFWLGVEGEPYNLLQREIRERFPHFPIVVMALADGWRPGYLPTADIYGQGIYQESIAVLAPGCLECLIDNVANQIEEWTTT